MQEHALQALKQAADNFEHPVFPCALIAGDVVILDLLNKLDYLKTGKVKVAFIDTFHLFDETLSFLHQLEVRLPTLLYLRFWCLASVDTIFCKAVKFLGVPLAHSLSSKSVTLNDGIFWCSYLLRLMIRKHAMHKVLPLLQDFLDKRLHKPRNTICSKMYGILQNLHVSKLSRVHMSVSPVESACQ